jgi:dTMP kinase
MEHGRSMLIAFCGIDGSGKTTQLKMLEDALSPSVEVVSTKQPTDAYRNHPRVRVFLDDDGGHEGVSVHELALLSAADRIHHLTSEIQPALDRGAVVLTDRYVYSAYCYFLCRGAGDLEWLKALNRHAPAPDLVFYLDTPVDVAMERVARRDAGRMKREEKDPAFLQQVADLFREQPWGKQANFTVLDGLTDPNTLHAQVLETVRSYSLKNGKAVTV